MILAIDRVREFIDFLEGKKTKKPKMAENYNNDGNSGDWIVPAINEVMEKSQKLSENIFKAEQEIQHLEVFLHRKVLLRFIC